MGSKRTLTQWCYYFNSYWPIVAFVKKKIIKHLLGYYYFLINVSCYKSVWASTPVHCICFAFTCTRHLLTAMWSVTKFANLTPDSESLFFNIQISLNQWQNQLQNQLQRWSTTKRCMNLIPGILMRWHLKKETLLWWDYLYFSFLQYRDTTICMPTYRQINAAASL